MNTPEKNLKDLNTLKEIADKLHEAGIEANLLEMEKTHLPLHLLSVPAYDEASGVPSYLMLSFFPMEEAFENNRYLQIFIQFDENLESDAIANLVLMLPEINQKTPIGHFGIQYEEGKAYYRYVLMVGENEKDIYLKIKELTAFLPFIFQIIRPSLAILAKVQDDVKK